MVLTRLPRWFFEGPLKSFLRHEVPLRAAAFAYHTFISLFPLLLFLIYIGSSFLTSTQTRRALDLYLSQVLPAMADELGRIVDQTIAARGTIGLIGGFGLLWSASAVFSVLTTTFDAIFETPARPFWRRRLIGLLTVALIAGLFLLSLFLATFGTGTITRLGRLASASYSVILIFGLTSLMLWLLYRVLPNRSVGGQAALGGALFAGLLWELAKWGFSWYLNSGFARFGLVYGSLASIVFLLLWLYFSAAILFLGAEIAANLERGSLGDLSQ